MRNAEKVLSIIHERGRKNLPVNDMYRQMFNPDLYLRAYSRISKNYGATTKGITEETVDGMSMKKIWKIIEKIRYERFKWTPVRRTHIPKSNGKMRPLGIPTWTDKLVQEVMRSLIEAYYEPQFSEHSHGFRPEKGCHTALQKVSKWHGTVWFIEGDIKGCFDNIDHETLLSVLKENIQDNRFLRLISNLLKAGYMENWKYNSTLSGTPQGGIISPLLSNIYLDRLDKFVETNIIPKYTKGVKRKVNPEYKKYANKAYKCRKQGDITGAKEYSIKMSKIPSVMTQDPDFRRCHYIRYADDFLLGFAGPKREAREIKEKIKKFLLKIKLELSDEKTLITHATTEKARFLGYDILRFSCETRRSVNGKLGLYVPREKLKKRCKLYMKNAKPQTIPERLRDSDFDIITQYGAEYRGYVQYYSLAHNLHTLKRLQWVMEQSLLKTLANKHKSTTRKIRRKYRNKINTPKGPRVCLKLEIQRKDKKSLIAVFGGIPLARKNSAEFKDQPEGLYTIRNRSELIQRLLANECELCESRLNIQIHHIRKLSDLDKPGRKESPKWIKHMAMRKRKTLAVCRNCHVKIHTGKPISKG